MGGCKHLECAQVGGMGDVVTALARAVQEEGHDVSVILPKYDVINYAEARRRAVLARHPTAVNQGSCLAWGVGLGN